MRLTMMSGLLAAAGLFLAMGASAQDAGTDPERRLDKVYTIGNNIPTIEEFVAEPTFFSAKLSPSGRYLAGVRRDGIDYYLVVADLSEPELKFSGTKFEDLRISEVQWATEDRLVVEAFAVFNRNTNSLMDKDDWFDPDARGYRVDALYGIDRDGENLVRFFEGDRDMDNIFTQVSLIDIVPSDPDHMLVSRRAPDFGNKKSDNISMGGADVFRVNVNSGDFDEYVRGTDRTVSYQTDADGNLIYRVDENSTGTRNIYYVLTKDQNGKTSWEKGASIKINDLRDELETPFKFQILQPAEEAPLFYVRDVPGAQDKHAIYLYNLATGEHIEKIAEHPEYDMEGGVFDPNTNELIGVRWQGETPGMLLFDPEQQKYVDALNNYLGEQERFQFVDMSDDGKKWLIFASGPGNPGSYLTFDLDEVKIKEVAIQRAALAGKATAPVQVVEYEARDGQGLFGYLTIPPGVKDATNLPLVMYPHGGPQARDTWGFDGMAQLLASRGYAVFQPQFRGSAGMGKTFAQSGYREWGGLMQRDVEDALTYLVDEGIADEDRVCIMGYSYGAYAAMQGAVATPDAYRCVLAGGGVYDLREMQKWSQAKRGSNSPTYEYWLTQLGDPVNDYDDLLLRSPARHVDRLQAPVFLFHGREDEIVPIEQAELLRGRLQSASKPFEYEVMEKSGHSYGAYRTDEPEVIRKQILAFLARHNPTERNPGY
ncbi:MAG: alpha/beta fold hydrolase [Henriciella sp.]|uniref:alpha/beta hydrolase family protein n=1 Tax=Henriciella sp. TaxID=1968823 RepID=UPI0032F050A6